MAEILLVEPAEPVSESVIEANKSRMDPLSTNKLVSTSAQIKDKINAKMSPEGRYLYNDQFSDITICDANGNNLVNNEYYSFIAKDKDKLYITKNNADTEVLEFSIPEQKIVKEEVEIVPNSVAVEQAAPVQEGVQPVEENVITSVPETEPVVENINEGFAPVDVAPTELSSVFNTDSVPSTEVTPVQEGVQPSETDLGEEITIPTDEVVSDMPIEGISFDVENETNTEEVDSGEGLEIVSDQEDYLQEAETDRALKSMSEKEDNLNSLYSEIENTVVRPEDRFSDSEVQIDSIDKYTEDDEYGTEYNDIDDNTALEENTTYSDAANVIRSLMQNNSEQKEELNRAKEELATTQEELDKVKASRKALSEKYNSQTRAMDAANDEIRDLKATVSKVEAERDSFEGKYHDLRRVSDLQKRELEKEKLENQKLRMKLASKDADRDELDQLVRDARALVNENNYYGDDNYSYRRVA